MAAVTVAVFTWTQMRRNFSKVRAKVCFAKEQLTYVDWGYRVCSKWRAAISTFPCSTLIVRHTHFDRVVLTQILHCRFALTKSDEAFFLFNCLLFFFLPYNYYFFFFFNVELQSDGAEI